MDCVPVMYRTDDRESVHHPRLAREQLGEIRAALAAYDAVATKSPDATLRTWARDRAAAVRAQPSQPGKPATSGEKKS